MFAVKGDRPQWRVIYEHISHMSIGDVVTDTDLQNLLPDTDLGSIRGAFTRATKECEREVQRTFTRVRKVGYRMVEPAEHEALARTQQRRAQRRVTRGRQIIDGVDLGLLDEPTRRHMAAVRDHLARQESMLKTLWARQDRAEQRIAVTEKDSANLADKVDRLTNLLERHGITD